MNMMLGAVCQLQRRVHERTFLPPPLHEEEGAVKCSLDSLLHGDASKRLVYQLLSVCFQRSVALFLREDHVESCNTRSVSQ